MSAILRNMSLRLKLILSFAVILSVPGLIIGYISYETAKSRLAVQLIRSADENVALLDRVIESEISGRIKDIDYLAGLVDKEDLQGSGQQARAYLEEYIKLHPEMNTIFIGTPDKRFLNAPKADLGADFDPTSRPWYQTAAKDSSKVAIAAPYISKTTGDFVISLSKVLRDGSGTIGAEIKLANLEAIAQQVSIGQHGFAVLLDQERKAIVHSEFAAGADLTGSWVEQVFGADSGETVYDDGSGAKRIRYATNALTGWKIGGVIEEAEESEQAAPILQKTLMVLAAAFLVFGALAMAIIWLIIKPVRDLGAVAARISEGDLTQRAEVRGKDEIGRLGSSFNAMADSLSSLLTQVQDVSMQVAASSQELTASAEQTSRATEQIAGSIQEVAEGASRQVEHVEQGAGSIRLMDQGIGRIAEGSEAVSQSAGEASLHSNEGLAVMEEAIRQMKRVEQEVSTLNQVMGQLDERSAAIGEIAAVMTDIAQQTNILSINASIEAARAGEHGRGFAVVAQEVKKLAEQSRRSAEEIAVRIGTVRRDTDTAVQATVIVVEGVGRGSESIRHAGELFDTIRSMLEQVAEQSDAMNQTVGMIAEESANAVEAMAQISETTAATADNTHDVSSATQEQLASMEEIASSSNALSRLAEDMQQLMSRFKM
ncbi:methyl-accepting chemotaxis protein [Paenibacillus sp. YN15]|uniref:methyl-accepting chemotaxis protein n=1 Tax=Paenibacillus sp. YN15 TaxID=1742774 RepID=UPI0015EB3BD8|nr:methyl-accepting chemotaxis protein [Paenibacillus sp. YN15]